MYLHFLPRYVTDVLVHPQDMILRQLSGYILGNARVDSVMKTASRSLYTDHLKTNRDSHNINNTLNYLTHNYLNKKKRGKARVFFKPKMKHLNIMDLTNMLMNKGSPSKYNTETGKERKKVNKLKSSPLLDVDCNSKDDSQKPNKNTKTFIKQLPKTKNVEFLSPDELSIQGKEKSSAFYKWFSRQSPNKFKVNEDNSVKSINNQISKNQKLYGSKNMKDDDNQLRWNYQERNQLNSEGKMIYANLCEFPKPKLKVTKPPSSNFPTLAKKAHKKKKVSALALSKVERPKHETVVSSKIHAPKSIRRKLMKKAIKKLSSKEEYYTDFDKSPPIKPIKLGKINQVKNKIKLLDTDEEAPKMSKKDFVLAFVSPQGSQKSKYADS